MGGFDVDTRTSQSEVHLVEVTFEEEARGTLPGPHGIGLTSWHFQVLGVRVC